MGTRSEQVQAHRFVTRRIVSALLSGEPESNELPMRRLGTAVLSSALVATIILAGVGVYGLLRPGGGGPQPGYILIERETGARYVYVEQERTLYPVVNFASARLIVGDPRAGVKQVSRRSLRGVRRAHPVGIAGAPDSLPDRSALLRLPWSVCSAKRAGGPSAPATALVIGTGVPGGRRLGADEALLVSTVETRQRWLLWNNLRLRVDSNAVLSAFGLASQPPLPVGEAFLNGVDQGPDLAPPKLAGTGRPSAVQLQGRHVPVGQVLRAGGQYYVATSTGLAPVGEASARLLLIDGGQVLPISDADVGRHEVTGSVERPGFPPRVPERRDLPPDGALCATYRAQPGGGPAVSVEVFTRAPADLTGAVPAPDAGRPGGDGVRTADQVVVPGGRGALVQPVTGTGTPAATRYLVTEQGVKYPLPGPARDTGADTAALLGYGGVRPEPVPATLLALLPTGPALDPAKARTWADPFDAVPGPGTTPSTPAR